ncbi:MAG: hypothetical protein AAGB12_02195 [Pseudomonadota bacterium]
MKKNTLLYTSIIGLLAVFFWALEPLEMSSTTEVNDNKSNENSAASRQDNQPTQSYSNQTQPTHSPHQQLTTNEAQASESNTSGDAAMTLSKRITTIAQRRPDLELDASQIESLLNEPDAWGWTDNTEGLRLSDEELVDGREFIQFESMRVEVLMPGDKIRLPIRQLGQAYEVSINSVVQNQGKSMTWSGVFIEEGNQYDINITQSDRLTYAGINTPQGHYEMKAYNGKGWIVSSGTLFKMPANESDAVIPPEEKDNDNEHAHEH